MGQMNSHSHKMPDVFDKKRHDQEYIDAEAKLPGAVRNIPSKEVQVPMVTEDESVYDVATKVSQDDSVLNEGGQSGSGGAKKGSEGATIDLKRYARFRTEMFAYMLAESAYDYAEELYKKHPNDPQIMAFLTETVWLYEKKKVIKTKRHWVDRMDILQRGIDISRRCIAEHPDFVPCYKNYTVLAVKMADTAYWHRWMASLGNVEEYEGIMKRGNQALELTDYKDFEICSALASLNGRVGTKWYSPYRLYGKLGYGIPDKKECIQRSKYYHFLAHKINPDDCENGVRLAMLYYDEGKYALSRRWYSKVRDGLTPTDQRDEVMQNVAHTHLCTRFSKSKWNFYKLGGADISV